VDGNAAGDVANTREGAPEINAILALIAAVHFGLLLAMLCGKWSNESLEDE